MVKRLLPFFSTAVLKQLAAAGAEIAGGDRYCKVPFLDRGDAAGDLARSLEALRKTLSDADSAVAEHAAEGEQQEARRSSIEGFVAKFERSARTVQEAVARAATGLRTASSSLGTQAGQVLERSRAIEQSAATTSHNVGTLAEAASQLDASLADLEARSRQAAETIAGAVVLTQRGDATLRGLSKAADGIGGMAQIIADITEQTRMLALNASIEAARAGEAGRGFAVVANEVKNLVTQIENATGEIESRVSEIRGAASGTASAMASISTAMNDVSGLVSAVAVAMQQQTAASQSITTAARSTATETAAMTESIQFVASAAAATRSDAGGVDEAAAGLAVQSDALHGAVATFLDDLDHGAIRVGILHSLSGSSAVGERPLKDVLRMEIKALNARGGLLGRPVEAIVYNPRSEPSRYAELADVALTQDRVCALFGTWSSASRKAVLPVLARHDGLLFYPSQYEGAESDPRVVYCGAPPNQQLLPAVRHLMSPEGGGARRFLLVGSDTLYSRLTHQVLRNFLARQGIAESAIGEEMLPLGADDWNTVADRIRAFARASHDAGKHDGGTGAPLVVSTVSGESNFYFFRALEGVPVPLLTVSIGEAEAAMMNPSLLAGRMVAWNYLMALDTPENAAFLADWRAYASDADAAANDAMEASLLAFRLWVRAVEKAGDPAPDRVRAVLPGLSARSLSGFEVFIDPSNGHLHKPALLGRLDEKGGMRIVWRSADLIAPQPILAATVS